MPKILSLCDYSGSLSQPYQDAGYDVIRIDLQREGCAFVAKGKGRSRHPGRSPMHLLRHGVF